MSVAGKLFLILLFVAIAPLVVFSTTALRVHEQALDADLSELHHKTAEYAARSTTASLDAARRTIGGLAHTIPWAQLSAEERDGALLLIYGQLDDLAVVALLDDTGHGLGKSMYRDPRHPVMTAAALEAFAHATATGAPIAADPPIVPLGFAVAGADGAKWTLAVGVSMRGVCAELAAASPPGVTTRLDDATGKPICGTPAIGEQLRATVPLAQGWSAIAEQPSAEAFASLARIRHQSMFWVGLAVIAAIAAGLVLTQVIRRPLRELARGAEALTDGKPHHVAITSRDEFGALAGSFNRMSGEIERKNTEIRTWNAELQDRVDARTAELRDAQDQLLQSRKLAAMAALGAGIAHEINNPLAGVLGMTQILMGREHDERTARALGTIEREALRVRAIVERMSSLAQESVRDAVRVDVVAMLEAMATAHADRFAAGHVELERAFTDAVPPVFANAAQLQHAVSQLVDNSIKAMPGGGRLRLAVRAIEGELVVIDVQDSGRGIAPDVIDKIFEPFFTTKDDWHGAGLGLTHAYRIVEAHQGRIRATSQLGSGTTMSITLPAARRGAHLA